MRYIFYILLLGITLFEGYRGARISNSLSEKFRIENEPVGLPSISNRDVQYNPDLPNQYNYLQYERRHKGKQNNQKFRSSRKPAYFSYNFQKLPLPSNNIGIIETDSDKDKKEEIIEKAFAKTITKGKPSLNFMKSNEGSAKDDYDEIIEQLQSLLKETENVEKKMLRLRRNEMENELTEPLAEKSQSQKNPVGYIDYSNSQMPFNEGQPVKLKPEAQKRNKRTGIKCLEESQETKNECKEAKSLQKRLGDLLRSKGENVEVLSDDAEYSRVRRYLDQVRRKRNKSITLETKEAAMSRVLDPNLNVDGILEPHVRKRRVSGDLNLWLED